MKTECGVCHQSLEKRPLKTTSVDGQPATGWETYCANPDCKKCGQVVEMDSDF